MDLNNFLAVIAISCTVVAGGCTEAEINEFLNSTDVIDDNHVENITEDAVESSNSTELLEDIREDQMTSLEIRTVFEGENDNLHVSMLNGGEEEVDFSEEMDFFINNFDYDVFQPSDLDYDREVLTSENGCLGDKMVLQPGETTADLDLENKACDTGIEFPSVFDEPVNLEFKLKDSHRSWSHECDPESGDQEFC